VVRKRTLDKKKSVASKLKEKPEIDDLEAATGASAIIRRLRH
jgi:hypothetical protein